MTHTSHTTHRFASLLLTLAALLTPVVAVAAENTTFVFASSCREVKGTGSTGFGGPLPDIDQLIKLREEDGVTCAEFSLLDPSSLQTSVLKAGDTLTVVVKVQNPSQADITRVRAWIAYDPAVLEGKTIVIDPAFPTVTPGESQFSVAEGYAKIGATAAEAQKAGEIVVATLTFTVKETSLDKTVISFYDYGNDATKHTLIAGTKAGTEEQLLGLAPGSLVVRIAPVASAAAPVTPSPAPVMPETPPNGALPSSAPLASSAPAMPGSSAAGELKPAATTGSAASAAPAPARGGIFPDYQVENLRVTTQGTAAYLGWDILASGELAGYNVYYGATSGQYLHRKSIDKSETTLAVRGLPEGTVYYFAVRGVNAAGVETEFSREVSVTIGKPQTSTSPLSASMIDTIGKKTPTNTNDGEVKGETGVGSSLAVILGICALVGTLIASRRQHAAFVTAPHVA